jgi:hypothetical protein
VADRRHIKQDIRQLQRVKTWQLLTLLVISGFIAATFLRLNNIGMIQRRDSVLAADREGNDADAGTRMYDLQRYVAAHMNASTGQFDLQGQYRRDLQEAVETATNGSNPNGNVNAKAEAVCRPRFAVWSPAYVQCFTEELAKYPPAPDPADSVSLPSPALYRHSFASPLWSPDFAGFSVLVSLVIVLIIIVRLAGLGILYLLLKHHYRGIGS